MAVVRLLALAPVAVAIALAWRPLYDATYHELILPDDLSTPLPLRVLREVPLPVIGIAVAWLLADAAACGGRAPPGPGAAAGARGVAPGLGRSRPAAAPDPPGGRRGHAGAGAAAGPALAAAAIGWGRVSDILAGDRDPQIVIGAVLVWVAIWLGCLVLAGVGSAVRAATWTLEVSTLGDPAPAIVPARRTDDPSEGPPSPR